MRNYGLDQSSSFFFGVVAGTGGSWGFHPARWKVRNTRRKCVYALAAARLCVGLAFPVRFNHRGFPSFTRCLVVEGGVTSPLKGTGTWFKGLRTESISNE